MTDQCKVRLLVVSSLYPNSIQPRHGVFVEERLRALNATGKITATVIAPVPWFPWHHRWFGRYAEFAAVPRREVRFGIEVLHPRYLVIPRVGMTFGPAAMAAAVKPIIGRLLREGCYFDLIDAHYFYPDGVAATKLGHQFDRPVVVTARGADINKIPRFLIPRRQIIRAAGASAAVVTVSQALKQALMKLGIEDEKITSLRNGVDLERFTPVALPEARAKLSELGIVTEYVWIAVGHLIERKGMNFAIAALAKTDDVTLMIAGTGPEEAHLRILARTYRVAERVYFLGHVEHDDLPMYFSAADALILPAESEGMPNVVLEAIACGAAVVATRVGGIPEVVEQPIAGALMDDRTVESVSNAWREVLRHGVDSPQRNARRKFAKQFSWTETSHGQLTLFRYILGDAPESRSGSFGW